eukprot:TRINITY_DN15781_c0_g1_i1.p1 TRINITY_DN15781_c0_g1~~TRINITY_DN15781_c0_g1_i1.p1  ORF type:complete len:129 (+),score=12.61 TRINITY_DN15781_c0_g1_i1:77-463(+)
MCIRDRRRVHGEACYEKNNACHQVCTVCGKVTEISLPAITRTVDDAHLKRFHKDGYSLYIYGICSSCAASITRRMNLEKKTVSYTHLRAHETRHDLVCRLLLEKKKKKETIQSSATQQQGDKATETQT